MSVLLIQNSKRVITGSVVSPTLTSLSDGQGWIVSVWFATVDTGVAETWSSAATQTVAEKRKKRTATTDFQRFIPVSAALKR